MTVLEITEVDEVVIPVPEDLDISSLLAFEDQLMEAVARRPRRLVLDCAPCRYLDAQAIRVLLDVQGSMTPGQGQIVLRGCHADTTRLLSLAGVLDQLHVERDQQLLAA